ncbi:MAG: hypothetical protein FWE65_00985 [Eggerthellaceae bacterium]|nr:hypothetical protein [Eggerthellaceae bacterium]
MAASRRLKMINFDLSTEKLKAEFGDKRYREAYSLIQRFLAKNNFEHHQYSGYLSKTTMSDADVYSLVLDTMIAKLPWLAECVEKFDATDVTSQSNMLSAIKDKVAMQPEDTSLLLEADDEFLW